MAYEIELVDLQPQQALVVCGHVAVSGMGEFLGPAFGEVMAALGGSAPAGPPFARYAMVEGESDGDVGFDVEAGFPVAADVPLTGRLESTTLPGGPAARVLYRGPYDGIAGVYEAVEAWFDAGGYVASGAPWESYLDGPEVPEPRTTVTWPCTPK